MNTLIARTAASAGLAAYLMSVALQVHRVRQDTGLDVDRFGASTALMYLGLLALSAAVLTDRRWVWWGNLLVSAYVFLQAPFLYYPEVAAVRPLDVWDWLEGTWFTGLVLVVCACSLFRLFVLDRSGRSGRSGRPSDERRPAPRAAVGAHR
ncbi:hypothetical protein [Phycicoccus avicenniae]|uniref:hypothetical protein n=1 Tax=Phycicoccus avicenniae TaxID=2828860 RepID=UPI003D29760E